MVRVIQFCLSGYDKLSNKEVTSRQINSTHVNDKLDIELSQSDFTLLCDYKDRPIVQFFEALNIGKHLQDILLYAISYMHLLWSKICSINQLTSYVYYNKNGCMIRIKYTNIFYISIPNIGILNSKIVAYLQCLWQHQNYCIYENLSHLDLRCTHYKVFTSIFDGDKDTVSLSSLNILIS